MKKSILTMLFAFAIVCSSQAQLVINEIMYNPPESGNDSLEYIEIYNAGNSGVDLTGYKLSVAVNHTFEAVTIASHGYVVVALNDTAFNKVFGFMPIKWLSGALNNSGEAVTLLDPSNNIIDVVAYTNAAPWPLEPNGNGPSLELCNPLNDNSDAGNWNPSNVATGISINGKEIFASPGAANGNQSCGGSAGPTVELSGSSFNPKNITVNVGETVTWNSLTGFHNVNGSLATYPLNPAGFFSGAPQNAPFTYQFTFTIAGLYNYRCDIHFGGGMVGTVTVIDPNAGQYPDRTVGEVTTTDANGVIDSLGVKCALIGIVHTPNFRPAALQFTIIDDQGDGIGVFNAGSNLGYTVTQGDNIKIEGVIAQFNGLAQMEVTKVTKLSSLNALYPATTVSELNENTESQLVKFLSCTVIDPLEWTTGTGTGFSVNILCGGNSVSMRVDNDIDLFNTAAPVGPFNLTGVGGQFDSSSPFTSGYQINPRYTADVDLLSATNDPVATGLLTLAPNPFTNQLTIKSVKAISQARIVDLHGRVVERIDLQIGSNTIQLDQLPAGVYRMVFQSEGATYTTSLVKQ
ncbi:MAG: lamin tail domain-containing protein [Saprospiraceae bacterium]